MKYLVAVSGGLDSMVLLDILARYCSHDLVVAHVDHAVRDNSYKDEVFVRKAARNYHLPYESMRLNEAKKDEATLRAARYQWLNSMREKHEADAIVTAHHQDDVLETMIINHLRGTGWRGLSSLRSHPHRYRPLLPMSKARIARYAIEQGIKWRDDPSNEDVRYLRNAVRHHVVPKTHKDGVRKKLVKLHDAQRRVGDEIYKELDQLHETAKGKRGIKRYHLIMLPSEVARELLYHVSPSGLQARHARQLLHFAKSARPGSMLRLPGNLHARVTTDELIVATR